jgi:acyl carrier protein
MASGCPPGDLRSYRSFQVRNTPETDALWLEVSAVNVLPIRKSAGTVANLASYAVADFTWAVARAHLDELPGGGLNHGLRDGLELDSLDFLNFVENLSERVGQRIEEDDYPKLTTLASAAAFVAGRS